MEDGKMDESNALLHYLFLYQIIQNEVSQKEKHQYSILTHIYGIQKDGNNNPVYETAKETKMNIEQSFELCGRGRGWDDLGEWH